MPGNSYNDGPIRKQIGTISKSLAKVEKAIKLAQSFDTYMLKQKEGGWTFDPQLPFLLARKNERFEYLFLDLMVTDKGNESIMNQLGAAGWFTNGMSIVDEDAGTASFIFKLHLEGVRYGTYAVNPCKFSYKCFSYELAQGYKLEGIINDLNKKGYDFLQTSAWNKTHSFALLRKVDY
jgi:hypothetical protein